MAGDDNYLWATHVPPPLADNDTTIHTVLSHLAPSVPTDMKPDSSLLPVPDCDAYQDPQRESSRGVGRDATEIRIPRLAGKK